MEYFLGGGEVIFYICITNNKKIIINLVLIKSSGISKEVSFS